MAGARRRPAIQPEPRGTVPQVSRHVLAAMTLGVACSVCFASLLHAFLSSPAEATAPGPLPEYASSLEIPSDAWRGQYFDSETLMDQKLERIDQSIDFDFGLGSPDPSIAPDTFSARWEGNWSFGQAGTYRFTMTTDDGMRVWVDENKVADEWKQQSLATYVVNVSLPAGVHRIKVEWNDMIGKAVAKVSWTLETPSSWRPSWLPAWVSTTQALAVVGVLFLALIVVGGHYIASRRRL